MSENKHYRTQDVQWCPPLTPAGQWVEMKSRWDIMWGRTSRQIADEYIATGEAKRRKDGRWDMRYRASRFVAQVEAGGLLI